MVAAVLCGWFGGRAAADSASTADPVLLDQRLRQLAGTVQALPETGSGITRDVGSIAVIEHDGSNYDHAERAGTRVRSPVARRREIPDRRRPVVVGASGKDGAHWSSHSSGSMASKLRPSEGFMRERYSTAFWPSDPRSRVVR